MTGLFEAFGTAWFLIFGWLPSPLDVICTVLVGLVIVVLLIKIIGAILDAIPFL